MMVARVGSGLELEASLDLQPGVAGEVAHIPQGVRLAFEEGHNDGATGGQEWEGVMEEGDKEGLVVADLAIYVGGFAADVGKVEDDSVWRGVGNGFWQWFCSVDAVDELVSDDFHVLLISVFIVLFRRRFGDGLDVSRGVRVLVQNFLL